MIDLVFALLQKILVGRKTKMTINLSDRSGMCLQERLVEKAKMTMANAANYFLHGSSQPKICTPICLYFTLPDIQRYDTNSFSS